MSRASIANIEAGAQRILAHTLSQIAKALGVEIDSLLAANSSSEPSPKALASELKKKLPLSSDSLRALAKKLTRTTKEAAR